MSLTEKKCTPCTGDETPLTPEQAAVLLEEVDGWQMLDDAAMILRELYFEDFAGPFALVQRISALAEAEGHHPDIAFGWGYCSIALQTEAIDGLLENDFIMAAKINNLLS